MRNSNNSKETIWHKPATLTFIFAIIAAFSLGGYLAWSQVVYSIGYPLDDAWIHQTYARNLAQIGKWEFIPGISSAGSTAPLFTFLLRLGYFLSIKHYIWTYILGWLCLIGIALAGSAAFRLFELPKADTGVWVGVFLLFEWHIIWAAGSGMETLLFSWIVLILLIHIIKPPTNPIKTGVLIGLSIWIRPDGITLLGPALIAIFLNENGWRNRMIAFIKLILSGLMLTSPYLWFNYQAGGSILPNTFYAKQAEYLDLQSIAMWERIAAQASQLLVGGGVLLLPGIFIYVFVAIQRKNWSWLIWIIWMMGYIIIYAWRLPVVYQHGRYLIPVMIIYFIAGFSGSMMFFLTKAKDFLSHRVALRVWQGSVIAVLLSFWVLGAETYAQDVAIIETEMVAAAKWVDQNTPAGSVVAAHDIGAMGYFSNKILIDLAGLVSPEVIPFIRDQNKLRDYLNQKGVDYLVTFPGWYPELVNCSKLVYVTGGKFSALAGGENMAVYAWGSPNGGNWSCLDR